MTNQNNGGFDFDLTNSGGTGGDGAFAFENTGGSGNNGGTGNGAFDFDNESFENTNNPQQPNNQSGGSGGQGGSNQQNQNTDVFENSFNQNDNQFQQPNNAPQGQGNAPQGNAPQGNAPQGNAPQGNAPQGNAPVGGVEFGFREGASNTTNDQQTGNNPPATDGTGGGNDAFDFSTTNSGGSDKPIDYSTTQPPAQGTGQGQGQGQPGSGQKVDPQDQSKMSFDQKLTDKKKKDEGSVKASLQAMRKEVQDFVKKNQEVILRMRSKTVEQILNEWNQELEEDVNQFNKLAIQVSKWDRRLMRNENRIIELYNNVKIVDEQQGELSSTLEMVETQQRDLEKTLDVIEKNVDQYYQKMGRTQADDDRKNTYELAQDIDAKLNEMGGHLKDMIGRLNSSYERTINPQNKFNEVCQVLSKHLASLQWIDRESEKLKIEIEKVNVHLGKKMN